MPKLEKVERKNRKTKTQLLGGNGCLNLEAKKEP